MHGQIAAVRALTSMFSSAIIRPRTIVKRSIAGRTFGEVICKLNPKSVESKVNINEIHFFCLPTDSYFGKINP